MNLAAFLPQTQTLFGGGGDGVEPGNCFASCVAAITGVPLAEVPNFAAEGEGWGPAFWKWAHANGWEWCSVYDPARLPMGAVIVSDVGPRGLRHACVWVGGEHGMVAWDPHPSRDGLTQTDTRSWITLTRTKAAEPGEAWAT